VLLVGWAIHILHEDVSLIFVGLYEDDFNKPSSTNLQTKWYQMSMCFVLWLVVMFSDMNIAPTLSICTIIGGFTGIPMDIITCATNFTSLAALESMTYSASLKDRVTLLWPLLCQHMGMPSKTHLLHSCCQRTLSCSTHHPHP